MTTLRRTIGPAQEPIGIDELRLHCRITELDESDAGAADAAVEEALLNALIQTAREMVEGLCGPLITQTWEQYEQGFPSGNSLRLWKPRVQAVSGLTYTDDDSTETTLSTTYYSTDVINEFRPAVVLNTDYSWPTVTLHPVNPIKVTFTAGYGDEPEDVPAAIRQAMLILCGHLYENREMYNISISGNSVVPIPWTTEALLAPYRAWGFEA
jgi:uncharacterized phiE125 gp8 family phage protein